MVSTTPLDLTVDFFPFINYESIVCTLFESSPSKVNAACMGVHFTSNNEVYLHVYEDTHSRVLLTPGSRFSINFAENFEEYVIAGLKQYGPDETVNELPLDSFRTLHPAPILKSSWCVVICEVIPMPEVLLAKPPCRRRQEPNVRASIVEQRVYHLPTLFNNRSTNLALEALILASRLPEIDLYSETFNAKLQQYTNIKKKLDSWRDMDRFENAFQRMDNYLIDHGIKSQLLFDI